MEFSRTGVHQTIYKTVKVRVQCTERTQSLSELITYRGWSFLPTYWNQGGPFKRGSTIRPGWNRGFQRRFSTVRLGQVGEEAIAIDSGGQGQL